MDVFDLFAKITLDTGEYERGLNEASGKTQSFGDKLKSGLSTAAKVGAAAIGAATTAAAGFAATSVNTGMTFDSAMSQVAATMGTTVDSIQNLREFAMDMGASTAFSATEAAEALNYMALAGYDADKSMAMLPNVLNLAAAGGINLASASDMVTDAQSALGLSLDETNELVDKMAKTSSKSNTSVAQLGEAILTVGGTAKNLAGGTTELSTALGILADNGVKGAEGGTALRNIILSLAAPTDKAKDTLLKFGGAEKLVYDEAGNMRSMNDIFSDLNGILSDMTQGEQTQFLNTLFNKVDLKSVNALLANTSQNMDGIVEELNNSGIAWDKYSDTAWMANSGIAGMVDEAIWNLKDMKVSAEELQDYLHWEYDIEAEDAQKIVEMLSSSLEENGSRWDELSGYIDNAAGSAQNMADVQLDNLSGDITLFKSALEGAQIVLSDQLTPTLREFVKFGADAISTLSTAFQDGGLTGAMEALGTILGDGLNMVIEQLPLMVDAGIQLLGALGQGILDNLPTITDAAIQIVQMLAEGIITGLPALAEGAVQIISMLASGIGEALPELLPAAMEAVLKFLEGLTSPESMANLLNGAVSLMNGLIEGLANAVPILIQYAPEIIANLVTGLIAAIPKLIEVGINLIKGLIEGLIQGVMAIPAAIVQVVSAVVDGFKALFGIHSPSTVFAEMGINLIEGLLQGIQNTWQSIVDFFSSAIDGIKEAWNGVKEFFGELWNGIQERASSAWGSVKESAQNAGENVKAAWKNMKEFFSEVWDAVKERASETWDNIKEGASAAWENTRSAWENTKEFFSELWDNVKENASETWDNLKESAKTASENVKSAWEGIKDFFSGLWNGIKESASSVWDSLKEGALNALNGIKSAWDNIKSLVSGKSKEKEETPEPSSSASRSSRLNNTIQNGMDFKSSSSRSPGTSTKTGQTSGNTYVTINSPKAVDAVEAAKEWKKTTQRMAMSYV